MHNNLDECHLSEFGLLLLSNTVNTFGCLTYACELTAKQRQKII